MLTVEKLTLCGIDADKANRILTVIRDKRDLSEYIFDFLEKEYPNTYKWVRACLNLPDNIEIKLEMINEIMGGYGIETLSEENWDNYQYPHYSYVNMGDTYATTILFNHVSERWILSSWGDIAEQFLNE
jgi:hypothetical protein